MTADMPLSGQWNERLWRRRVVGAIILYFLLHLSIRLLVSGSVELDEAEQVLLSQQMALGYGSQPPLYTWLQAGLFALFGPGVFALALLKNTLLLFLYLLTFCVAREMTGEDRPALAAMLSLFFIPQIAWEAQRDLTHSVLATTLAAATLYAAVRLCRRGKSGDYLLFGLCGGLGILAKYNFAVFMAALLLAGLTVRQFRERFLRSRMLLGLLVLFLVTGPHLGWVLTHTGEVLRQAGTFERQALSSVWLDYARGGVSLVRAIASFLAPVAGIYLLLFFRWRAGEADRGPFSLLLGKTLLYGGLLCGGLILVFRVTHFKDRWMQPLLFASAIYLPLLVRRRLADHGLRRLAAVASVVAIVVLIWLPGRTLLASQLGKSNRLNAPFSVLGQALRQAGFEGGDILAGNRWVGGNLRLRFPGSVVRVPELPEPPVRPAVPCLVVWDATRHRAMPSNLRDLCEKLPGCRADDPARFVEAPLQHADGKMYLGYQLVRP